MALDSRRKQNEELINALLKNATSKQTGGFKEGEIKSNDLGFTPSHICPGHTETKVNCCAGGNFQGWRDREIPEKNILNHVFGIKNGKAIHFCQEIRSVISANDDSEIHVLFRNGDRMSVLLDRLGDDLQSKVIQRAMEFAGNDSAVALERDDPLVDELTNAEVEQANPLRNPLAGCKIKPDEVGTPAGNSIVSSLRKQPGGLTPTQLRSQTVPGSVTSSVTSSDKRTRYLNEEKGDQRNPKTSRSLLDSAGPRAKSGQSVKRAAFREAVSKNDTEPHDDIPSDWPFLTLWKQNDEEFTQAQAMFRKAQEMREMLLATLNVFQRNRSA